MLGKSLLLCNFHQHTNLVDIGKQHPSHRSSLPRLNSLVPSSVAHRSPSEHCTLLVTSSVHSPSCLSFIVTCSLSLSSSFPLTRKHNQAFPQSGHTKGEKLKTLKHFALLWWYLYVIAFPHSHTSF